MWGKEIKIPNVQTLTDNQITHLATTGNGGGLSIGNFADDDLRYLKARLDERFDGLADNVTVKGIGQIESYMLERLCSVRGQSKAEFMRRAIRSEWARNADKNSRDELGRVESLLLAIPNILRIRGKKNGN